MASPSSAPQKSSPVQSPSSASSFGGSRPQLEKSSSSASNTSSAYSPRRHHERTVSSNRTVKETRNARSEYSTSQDDGASQRRINQYLIQQEIGRGSFGAVHLATDQYGQEYAVKEFSKSRLRKRAKSNLLRQRQLGQRPPRPPASGPASPSPSEQQPILEQDNSFDLIKEEIAIMKKLNHQNLVSLIEVLDDPEEDSLYMVLEMCKKGVVLRIEIDECVDPYDDENCRHWFRDLILGIEYLHSQGVIHRDIKPDNCLLTDDDMLKIVDFGVSEMFEKSAEMKVAKSAGSPAFMAPELCEVKKEGVSGVSADIWSMGVTLYCLKFGRVPFQKHAVMELYNAIMHDPIEFPTEIDDNLKDLFVRLFEKDPAQRIKMEQIREHPWVTKDGVDPLLSKEENCADAVAPPTEEEKNTAITNNMGRLIAVLRAANRFKTLLRDRHPELMESIFNRASRMVQPPLSMNVYQAGSDVKHDLKEFFRHYRQKDGHIIDPHDHLPSSGIYRDTDVHSEIRHITESLKRHVFTHRHRTVDARMESDSAPPGAAELAHFREEHEKEEIENRRHSYDNAKGHAHDPLEDDIFLYIGQGPEEESEQNDVGYVVSESPQPTDVSVYEEAYKDEVDKIHKSGRSSTIFLTRRVEGVHGSEEVASSQSPAASRIGSGISGSKRARMADLVGRAWHMADSTVQHAREHRKS